MKVKNVSERVHVCKEGSIAPLATLEISEASFKAILGCFPNEIVEIKPATKSKPEAEKK